ncbi:hypothetical protein TKK_0005631 [Trichogramma kaykai]|uniref:SSD domain-containing protein n=1 Tax=Trichogramma kaykai TaxID=54128 RepID=A0ABD2XHN2_9HYME
MLDSFKCVDYSLNKAFYKIGSIVGLHPKYFIITPVIVTFICIIGFRYIHYEIDPEYLFSPINGPGKHERAIVEQFFRMNYTKYFNLGRITRPGRFGHVIVISKDDNQNMLRKEIWEELRLLDTYIKNFTVNYENESFNFSRICARWLDYCYDNDILNLEELLDDFEQGNLNLTFPVMFNPITWDAHIFPVYFGGSVVNQDFMIQSTPSVQMGYFLRADSPAENELGAIWEEGFLDVVGNLESNGTFEHISVARFASRTLELEFEANTKTIIPYFTSTFLIMVIFSVLTCTMLDCVRSKPWIGFFGNVSAGMATVSAFGLCCFIGIDFIGINLAAPFLMIGIGIDDTFVMLAAWRRTNIKDSVPVRMSKMLSEAAVSITITSLTDMVSFFIGILSVFPSVQIFCIYSGFAVIFTFVYHLTFFAGCVALSGYCEQDNLHSLICYPVQPLSKSSQRSWFYRLFCSGGVNNDDPNNPIDNTEHGCMKWFRDYLGAALNNMKIKYLVLITFGVYLVGAIYGLTNINEGLDRRKLSKKDSYSIVFYDREEHYFREYPYRIQVMISGKYDYSDPSIQMEVENLTRRLEASDYISNVLYTESWLRSFLSSSSLYDGSMNETVDIKKSFIKELRDEWLHPTSPFSLDLKFNKDNDEIIASRFLIQAVNISGTNQEKEMVKELRQICSESSLNASVFHPYFVFFDQFELIRPTSIQCLIFGALIMMVITFLFIPNVLCCFWVAFCIISIECGVAGYMALWDVSLDSISMINLIMCIGFSVDFTAHICYAYMSSEKIHANDRVRECLYNLGLPIVQGAFSTILGLLALVLADTYIFLVFFKMVFLVVLIGSMHGLFLLPVLLSLFGPVSRAKVKTNDPKKDDSILPELNTVCKECSSKKIEDSTQNC